MDSFNYVIVGSGPAGVSAALSLERRGTCMIDVGQAAVSSFPFNTLTEALTAGDLPALIGNHWEMLANLALPLRCHPKLRGAAVKHVMEGERFEVVGESGEILVEGRGSYAAGGMANLWGAQLLRYTEADLIEAGNWPITASQLDPHYAQLEEHIGLSGAVDDMEFFLGSATALQPPAPIVPAAQYLFNGYTRKRNSGRLRGLRIGQARLAVLTRPYRNRPAYTYGETEFFSTAPPGLYTPRQTLNELQERAHLTYLGGWKCVRFHEFPEHVEIEVEDVTTLERRRIQARHLLLGCGTIQTSRLVLLHANQPTRRLPFLDHPPTLLPFFFPATFGHRLPDKSFPVQLVGTLGRQESLCDMISFYYPGGMLRSDLLPDIPLPVDVAFDVLKVIMSGMLVAQIWETSRPSPENRLSLNDDGSVRIDYPHRPRYSNFRKLLSAVRALGGFSMQRLASMPPPTWGFHHACSLPMRIDPGPFETHVDGRLWNSRRIRVIDGSVLPSLPAKNHSFTIMANAARIAESARCCEY